MLSQKVPELRMDGGNNISIRFELKPLKLGTDEVDWANFSSNVAEGNVASKLESYYKIREYRTLDSDEIAKVNAIRSSIHKS